LSENGGAQDIRVKMKIGEVEIEIQCQEEQLQSAVDKILRTVAERLRGMPITTERPRPAVRAETCKGTIQRLLKLFIKQVVMKLSSIKPIIQAFTY